MKPYVIFGSSRYGISQDINPTRVLNCYYEADELNKNNLYFIGAPGLRFLKKVGTGPIRGFGLFGREIYFVSGSELWKLDAALGTTLIGSLNTTAGHVDMDENGVQLFIADGKYGYIYDGTLQQVTDPAYTGSKFVKFVDGYFIFDIPETGKAAISSSYDGLTHDALDYKTAEKAPDNLRAIERSEDYLWMLGAYTTELWYNAGSRFPFQLVQGGVMNWGIIAPYSVSVADNAVIWLSRNKDGQGVVVLARGPGSPRVISTKGMAHLFRNYRNLGVAYSFSYLKDGDYFYQITFPADGKTWVYQLGVDAWFEREQWNRSHHRACCHIFFEAAGINLVGDYENGNLYALDSDTYTDNDERIRIEIDSKILNDGGMRTQYDSLILDMETGVGNPDEPDPRVALRYSDDSSHNWSHPIIRDLGVWGQYSDPPLFNRLGSAVNRSYRVECTNKAKFRMSATVYIEKKKLKVFT